ncbi:hypothetical protein CAPTEDRAFT_227729 [Capitella teleta]|uniref:GCF C-terminal domain-containing protein n=1 Tax=Capitella teleta TaxID=283909 RepID=R7UPQ4_CAPTE|nr:hypothetical protein CAPTEDRAFT_227729 [Capitella teleta]|eukprot:ELU08053.1 hypothetical protein CAPTEDRAFT_227729 [Capitella teleta]
MFKKPKRNFRGRRKNSGNDEDSNSKASDNGDSRESPADVTAPSACVSVPDPLSTGATVKPKKIKKKKHQDTTVVDGSIHRSSSTLSFGQEDDEEGEVFQIKKSSHSRRVAKQLKKESRREKEERAKTDQDDDSDDAPATGYSMESLKKLQAEQNAANGHVAEVMLGSDAELSEFDDEDDEEGQDETGQIPDATMIHLARKKRQLAREQGEENFIPLDDTQRAEKGSKSRLVREEDHDKSDDDGERLDFSVDAKEKERRHIETTILAAAEEDDYSGGSEDGERWIQEQIRKGIGNQSNVANEEGAAPNNALPMQQQHQHHPMNETPANRVRVPRNLQDFSIDAIKKRLEDRLTGLVSVHRTHEMEMADLQSRVEECSLHTNDCGGRTKELEQRYRFYHDMRCYVSDLVECMNEKMSSILYLDRSMNTLYKNRTEKFVARRQEDVRDQSVLCQADKPGFVQEIDPATQRRTAEREGRRTRRRRAREMQNITEHYDGLSTDDEESKMDTNKFCTEKERIAYDASTIFDDVVEEFHHLKLIKSRFDDWQEKQKESYDEAYIGLCLPKLFTPLVNVELINWNPLERDARNFEEMSWFETLMLYGCQNASEDATSPDNKLMPSLVEKTVVHKVIVLVEEVWDPLSMRQTQRLIALIRRLVQDYPVINAENKTSQALLKAVATRLKRCLDDDVFVPLYAKQILESKSSPQYLFFNRQFWSAVKLFRVIVLWEDILSTSALQELALDGLLNRYLVLGLYNSPVDNDVVPKCQAVADAIPQNWFTMVDSKSTLPQLQNLVRVLSSIGATFMQQINAVSEFGKVYARNGVKQVSKMLVTLHAAEQAALLVS